MRQSLVFFAVLTLSSCGNNTPQHLPAASSGADTSAAFAQTDTAVSKILAPMRIPTPRAGYEKFRILPVNESSTDTSLVQYLHQLQVAVNHRDTSLLRPLLAPHIISSYGGGLTGYADFVETWKLRHPATSRLWPRLTRLLALGGAWETDDEGLSFRLPYAHVNKFFAAYSYDFDWYTTVVCVGPAVRIYAAPQAGSAVVAKVRYRILKTSYENAVENTESPYAKVYTLADEPLGYVKKEDAEFTAGESLILRKRRGHWQATAFAPYD